MTFTRRNDGTGKKQKLSCDETSVTFFQLLRQLLRSCLQQCKLTIFLVTINDLLSLKTEHKVI